MIMKSRSSRVAALLALASANAAFAVTTSFVNFDDQPAALQSPVSSDPAQTVVIPGVATFTGGVVGNLTANLDGAYVTPPNAYGTAKTGVGSPNPTNPLQSALTIAIDPSYSVNQVSLPVFNGAPVVLSYQVNAYSGSTMVASQTLNNIPAFNASDGSSDPDAAVADLTASNITSVTIAPTTLPNGDWDFIIDSVAFNQTAQQGLGAIGPSLTWDNAGASGNGTTWDTTQQNWSNSGAPALYTTNSAVTFNDANNNHYAVTLNTSVSPYSVAVANNSGNYTISGSGSITGATGLAKSGTDTLTLSTVNTYTGGTIVSAGTLVVGVHGALPNGALGITGGTVKLSNNTGAAAINSLSISSGASLDIGNNHVIVSYAPGTQAMTDAAIRGYLTNGYNGGLWNGTSGSAAGGGINSSTAALPANSRYGIGYADGADGIVTGLSSGQIEIKYTLLGDADLDGSITGSDFTALVGNLGKSVTKWDQGDFFYTGTVTGSDFTALVGNLGKTDSGADVTIPAADYAAIDAFAAANGLMADVPEPTTTSLLALAMTGALLIRRRTQT
jgi:autotransporter-associated beta strand protein